MPLALQIWKNPSDAGSLNWVGFGEQHGHECAE